MNLFVSMMTSAVMWRGKMTEYNIIVGGVGVSICKDCDDELGSFIDIYTDDKDFPSPFEDVKTAKLFAEIIVKLLKVVDKDDIE